MTTTKRKAPVRKQATLYDRLGGDAALTAAIDGFYQRVLRDPSLKPFFKTTNMDRLKSQQLDFLAEALGGPQRYNGLDMKTAHQGMGVEKQHFDRVAEHLVAVLADMKVPAKIIDEIAAKILPLAGDRKEPKSQQSCSTSGRRRKTHACYAHQRRRRRNRTAVR